MDATRYRSILFFRDIDKTERTFFNESSEVRRETATETENSVWVGGNEKSWESEWHTIWWQEG